MHKRRRLPQGFTIVELLIVVVVIAILAAISVVAYTGIQDRARVSKAQGDIRTIVTAVQIARINESKSMLQITGSGYTGSTCASKPSGTDLAALPDSDTCISRYKTTLNAISTASGTQLGDIRDPWGRPYKIDENEGENGFCSRDTVAMFAYPFNGTSTHPSTPSVNVPISGFTHCS